MDQEGSIYRLNREYLSMFSAGEKSWAESSNVWKVQAKGFPKGVSMPVLSVDSSVLSRLIDPATGGFMDKMYFDDHQYYLSKIEILHASRTVNIHVKHDSSVET